MANHMRGIADGPNHAGRRMNGDDDILDDLFHGAALAAYVELARTTGGVPDVEATRRLAFRYFEEALAEKHGRSPRG